MRENEGSTHSRAPRSLFLGLISLHSARSNFARVLLSSFFSSRLPRLSLPPASVSSFCPVGCCGAQRHGKKESGIGPLLSFSFLLCRFRATLLHPWLRRVGLWMLSLSYLVPPSWSSPATQWRYQHIHSFQILLTPSSSSYTHPPPFDCPPQRRNEHTNETRGARERGRTENAGISWILLSL